MDQLFITLQNAASQDINLVKQAENNLAIFEKEQNFYSSVLNFYFNQQLDVSVRYMALLIVKNGIDKYWRKTQNNCINPDEKKVLKSKLLETFSEPIDQLATQYAVIISKIARPDCPDDWEELMPLLLQRVNSIDELEQKRSLQILVQVVKTLATKRFHHDRMMFERFTSNLYSGMVNLWNGYTGLYFQDIQNNVRFSICENNLKKAIKYVVSLYYLIA